MLVTHNFSERTLQWGAKTPSLNNSCHVQACNVKQLAAGKERTFHQPLLGGTSAYQSSRVSTGLCCLSGALYALLLL